MSNTPERLDGDTELLNRNRDRAAIERMEEAVRYSQRHLGLNTQRDVVLTQEVVALALLASDVDALGGAAADTPFEISNLADAVRSVHKAVQRLY